MIEYENLGESNKKFFSEYLAAFQHTLNSGWYILGNNVKNFEIDFAQYHFSRFCIGVNSGLDALILGLKGFDFPPGSEIIVPSNTYIATILAIIHCGHKPVLVEPDIRTYNIDPDKIEEKITPRTKGMMIVHLYGKPCDMDRIMEIKKKHNLVLIEDCAQSHGAKYNDKLTGTFGELGAFSFYPTKNLGALGDGGAIITNDPLLATTLKRLRNYGSDVKYYNEIIGFNSRLQEFQAGFLSVKLKYLDEITKHKRKLASIYNDKLSDEFIKPVSDWKYYDVFHIYNVRHPKRDELRKYLLENGIKTEIHYPVPPHKQKAMIGIIEEKHFPVSEEIHATTLSLPISFGNSEMEISEVVEVMNKF
ncbi:MAG: DegT/DnrJ/EryC1/StrS family aminotransferase [Ignavibacteriaceae bacterium]